MRNLPSFLLAAIILPSLLACGGLMGKTTECNSFISAVNEALPTIQKISNEPTANGDIKAMSDQMKRIGDEYKKLSDKLQAMNITDAGLKTKVDEYKRMTKMMADTTHHAAAGAAGLNMPALMRVQKQMGDLAKDEDRLVNEINAYCSGS